MKIDVLDFGDTIDIDTIKKIGNIKFKEIYIDNILSLKGKNISFASTDIDDLGFYKKYLHLGSMGKDENNKYDTFPCQNDKTSNLCIGDCTDKQNFITHHKEGSIERMLCIFRISRLEWVKTIIELAEKNDSRVKIIVKNELKNGRQTTMWKVWYSHNKTDFLVILMERHNKLIFITGYPVVMKSMRKGLKDEWKIHSNKK